MRESLGGLVCETDFSVHGQYMHLSRVGGHTHTPMIDRGRTLDRFGLLVSILLFQVQGIRRKRTFWSWLWNQARPCV